MKKQKRMQTVGEQIVEPTAYRPIGSLIPSHWREEWVVANGIRQHLYRTGSRKTPLVLFHGFMECGLSGLRLANTLEEHYEVVMPDARAHGRSDSPGVDLTPSLLAEDAAELIRALKLDSSILFGRSNGAVTAALVASMQPKLARAVLLEDPPMGGMPRPNVSAATQGGENWFDAWLQWMQGLSQRPHEERIASTVARWPHGAPVLPDEPIWPEEEFVPWVEGLAQFDTSIFRRKISFWSLMPYLEQVAQVSCPILLLAGNPDHGSLVSEDGVELLKARWQRGTLVRIENAGHVISRGRTFASSLAVIKTFLGQHSPSRLKKTL
jgi:pimeloyl-ACP methyl ester carboxylesterase